MKRIDVTCTAVVLAVSVAAIGCFWNAPANERTRLCQSAIRSKLGLIHVSQDGTQLVNKEDGSPFIAWGFNYDHDDVGRLLEDYWQDDRTTHHT